ncbi:hypothetical protein [Rhodoligotrophos defluvii]|uniref:hypothetical protein n=1 Tax=Rhodoligotrophos defluvii TaxID=2561934 RepID=UPI0010C937D6|nr:hypothetical protein [Rhodoligotrophos defluvii]
MGIALLVLGALISLGGWGVLLTGFGLEASAPASGLPYLPSNPTVDGMRLATVEQIILLGYLLMTLGAIAFAASKIIRLIHDFDRDEQDLSTAPLAPVASEPLAGSARSVGSSSGSLLGKARQSEPSTEDVDESGGFAQVVQEGDIEGHHFIEYDNGIVDVQTATGWRRFDSLEQAVEQLRREA